MLLVILTHDPSYTNCPFITLGNFMKITLWKIANIESKRHASTLRHTVYGICVYGASSRGWTFWHVHYNWRHNPRMILLFFSPIPWHTQTRTAWFQGRFYIYNLVVLSWSTLVYHW